MSWDGTHLSLDDIDTSSCAINRFLSAESPWSSLNRRAEQPEDPFNVQHGIYQGVDENEGGQVEIQSHGGVESPSLPLITSDHPKGRVETPKLIPNFEGHSSSPAFPQALRGRVSASTSSAIHRPTGFIDQLMRIFDESFDETSLTSGSNDEDLNLSPLQLSSTEDINDLSSAEGPSSSPAGVSQRGQSQQTGTRGDSEGIDSPTSSRGYSQTTSKAIKKRNIEERRESGSDDEGGGAKRPRHPESSEDGDGHGVACKRYACPYYQRQPFETPEKAACFHKGFNSVSRTK